MKDVQKRKDKRGLSIDKVGVKGLEYPIIVLDKEKDRQPTVASINMYVELPQQFKGTHMSRFIEILNQYKGEITLYNMGKILDDMLKKLEAETAHIEISFKYFIQKKAPISKIKSLMGYGCKFIGEKGINHEDYLLEVTVPLITLCPCSKEISDFGAHNQRSFARIRVRTLELVWIEDLIEVAEKSASAAIYPLLKRADEKHITERAYENPVFIEDLVRNIAEKMISDKRIIWFSIEGESLESIHNHNAYAYIERDKYL
ncbi:MAG: GTP cyclohydrolase I FolE2 [Candidatus Coatesbacteria bacterium]|nr:GTP cyclohydrolase I FolE2 [Candidatus Coatesbacteria bacterium]